MQPSLLGWFLLAALGLEGWAALAHRWLWHGPLWVVHRSHHRGRRGRLEANDAFAVLHALLAMALVARGFFADAPEVLALGLGATAYGLAYVAVHDGFIHGRLPLAWLGRSSYLRAVRAAHLAHHAAPGGPYGLLAGPWLQPRGSGRLRSPAGAPRVQAEQDLPRQG
jgi:beta-carotene 3-hydroxylase